MNSPRKCIQIASHQVMNCTSEHHRSIKTPNKLPNDFYEKILRFETLLFQSLDKTVLDKILQLYMTGVEYYELRDSSKALGFQSRTNWLLSKPEIMQLLQKENDENKKQFNSSSFESDNIISTLKRRISIQNKLLIHNKKENLQQQCQNIIKNMVSHNEDKVKLDNLLKEEFKHQKNDLIERLNRRKATHLVTNFSNSRSHCSIMSNANPNVNVNETCNEIQHASLYDITEINSNSSHSLSNSIQLSESIEKTSIEENNNQNEINEGLILPMMMKNTESPESKQTTTNATSTTTMDHITNIINTNLINGTFCAKQKEMLLLIKEKIDEYLFSYNKYFYEEHYKSTTKKIEQLFAEKYCKYIRISKTYQDQIKETQYELATVTKLSDEQIDLIVYSLNEEKDHELSKLDVEYNNLLKEHIASFKALGFQQNSISVQYLQEKAKLDIYNCLLSLFTS